MPKFSANLSMMFTEHPFLARFDAARACGFDAVEFLFPYAHSADEIGVAVQKNDLQISVFNLPPGDWESGDRGLFPEVFNRSLYLTDCLFSLSVKFLIKYKFAE